MKKIDILYFFIDTRIFLPKKGNFVYNGHKFDKIIQKSTSKIEIKEISYFGVIMLAAILRLDEVLG